MATLYITEYAEMDGKSIPREPAIASQNISYTGTAGASAAFNGATQYVAIQSDGICSVLFGTGPTATTAKRRIPLGETQYFKVPVNQAYKVSAIVNT